MFCGAGCVSADDSAAASGDCVGDVSAGVGDGVSLTGVGVAGADGWLLACCIPFAWCVFQYQNPVAANAKSTKTKPAIKAFMPELEEEIGFPAGGRARLG